MRLTTFIYTLSDKNGDIRYIGKTNTPRKRLYSHIQECKTSNKSHKINWVKSLLAKNEVPIIDILEEVSIDDWKDSEIYWIEQFRQWGFKLTNISIGGSNNNYKRTIETKQKMRKSKLGSKLSKEHKEKISLSVKEKYIEIPNYNRSGNNSKTIIDRDKLYKLYIIENLSMPKISKKLGFSEKKIWQSLKECDIIKPKENWIKQLSSHPKKVVLQYDLEGNFLKEWEGIPELGINKSNIANCCRGVSKSAGGYIWRYKDSFIEIDINKMNEKKRSVRMYDLSGNFIKEYSSLTETAIDWFNDSNVQLCCSGKQKSHKGYIWRYSEDEPPIKYKNKTIRKVVQYDKNMNLIKEWDSISLVTRELKIGGNTIVTCCKGRYKSAGGYIWKYKEDKL